MLLLSSTRVLFLFSVMDKGFPRSWGFRVGALGAVWDVIVIFGSEIFVGLTTTIDRVSYSRNNGDDDNDGGVDGFCTDGIPTRTGSKIDDGRT